MYSKRKKKLKRFCFINSKLVNELCYMLQSGEVKEKRKKEKGERRKGLLRDISV